nr:unnamed protein product [Callosobruchus analis]
MEQQKKYFRSAKSMLPPCNPDKCLLKCTNKVTEERRRIIFTDYWASKDLETQRIFILSQVSNISFHIPKKDQCNFCVGYYNSKKRKTFRSNLIPHARENTIEVGKSTDTFRFVWIESQANIGANEIGSCL